MFLFNLKDCMFISYSPNTIYDIVTTKVLKVLRLETKFSL